MLKEHTSQPKKLVYNFANPFKIKPPCWIPHPLQSTKPGPSDSSVWCGYHS